MGQSIIEQERSELVVQKSNMKSTNYTEPDPSHHQHHYTTHNPNPGVDQDRSTQQLDSDSAHEHIPTKEDMLNNNGNASNTNVVGDRATIVTQTGAESRVDRNDNVNYHRTQFHSNGSLNQIPQHSQDQATNKDSSPTSTNKQHTPYNARSRPSTLDRHSASRGNTQKYGYHDFDHAADVPSPVLPYGDEIVIQSQPSTASDIEVGAGEQAIVNEGPVENRISSPQDKTPMAETSTRQPHASPPTTNSLLSASNTPSPETPSYQPASLSRFDQSYSNSPHEVELVPHRHSRPTKPPIPLPFYIKATPRNHSIVPGDIFRVPHAELCADPKIRYDDPRSIGTEDGLFIMKHTYFICDNADARGNISGRRLGTKGYTCWDNAPDWQKQECMPIKKLKDRETYTGSYFKAVSMTDDTRIPDLPPGAMGIIFLTIGNSFWPSNKVEKVGRLCPDDLPYYVTNKREVSNRLEDIMVRKAIKGTDTRLVRVRQASEK